VTPPVSAAPLVTGRDWRRAVRRRIARAGAVLRTTWPRVLLGLALGIGISFGVAYLVGPSAPGQVRDGLGWLVATTTVTGLVTRLCLVGPRQFARELRRFPGRIVSIVREDGSAALAHVLFGFAAGSLITWLLGPTLSGALGVGLFIGLGTFLRPIVVGGAMVVWRWVVTRASRTNPAEAGLEAMTVSILGSTAAMALALAVPSASLRLVLGVGAIIAGLLLGGSRAPFGWPRIVLGVVVAALGAVALIGLVGGFQPAHVVWLLPFGLAVGVLLSVPLRRVRDQA
jgi:hypothetical protein